MRAVAKRNPGKPIQPSPDLWQELKALKTEHAYVPGAALFRSGQPVQGVYLVERGEVRLLVPASAKSAAVLGKAGPGTVLGLSEALTGAPYKLTAEAASHVQVAFVERDRFLNFLREHHDFCLQIVHLLSEEVHVLYHHFRTLSTRENKTRGKHAPPRVN